MSSFSDAIKYLDFAPARKATLEEAQTAPVPFDKYYQFQKARKIGKVYASISFPIFEIANAYKGLQARIDFSLPNGFVILPFYGQLAGLPQEFFLAISHVNDDNTVSRYILTSRLTQEYWWDLLKNAPYNPDYVDIVERYSEIVAPFYTGQSIKKDFSLEIYSVQLFAGLGYGPIQLPATRFTISLLENPIDASTLTGTDYTGTIRLRDELVTEFPEIY